MTKTGRILKMQVMACEVKDLTAMEDHVMITLNFNDVEIVVVF